MALRVKNVVRLAKQITPVVAASPRISALNESDFTPIQVVCSYDFKTLFKPDNLPISKDILVDNWFKMERRFPRLYPKNPESKVRRSVCPLLDKYFKTNRFFMYVEVLFEGLQDLHLLVCTRLSTPIGVRCGSSLLVFGTDSFLETQEFTEIVGDGVDRIYYLGLTVPLEMSYLTPAQINFETAFNGVIKLFDKLRELRENALVDSIWSDFESKTFDEQCIGLLFQTTFFGMMYPSLRNSVLACLEEGSSGVTTPEEVLFFRGNWENVSNAYYLGEKHYLVEGLQFDTDEELVVLKAAKVPPVKVGSWNDTTIFKKQRDSEEEFVKELIAKNKGSAFNSAARNAWDHARFGYDEEEHFAGLVESVASLSLNDRAELVDYAKKAWKAALDVYH